VCSASAAILPLLRAGVMTDDEYAEFDGLGLADRIASGEVSAGEL
jgi:hypothetical protein